MFEADSDARIANAILVSHGPPLALSPRSQGRPSTLGTRTSWPYTAAFFSTRMTTSTRTRRSRQARYPMPFSVLTRCSIRDRITMRSRFGLATNGSIGPGGAKTSIRPASISLARSAERSRALITAQRGYGKVITNCNACISAGSIRCRTIAVCNSPVVTTADPSPTQSIRTGSPGSRSASRARIAPKVICYAFEPKTPISAR
jgi:hypothetical protein